MGKKTPPPPAPAPQPVVDPNANEVAKASAAEAMTRQQRRLRSGTYGNTLATTPEGTLGSPSTSSAGLKSTLG